MRTNLLAVCCLLTLLAFPAFAAEPVELTELGSGTIKEKAKRKLAPASGFITSAESWKKLRSAWSPGEELPKVDFNKELILLGTVPGPNRVLMRPALDDQGDVKFRVAGTRIGGPGFGYKFVKIAKAGVKTVNGQPLEPKGVRGVLVIPEKIASFDDHVLEIKLWEYDPFLADVGATLIDDFELKKFRHQQGKLSETAFTVGPKLEPRKDRRYYITVFVLKDGRRTHIGEIDGNRGLGKVLTKGATSSVKVIARPVR